MESQLTTGACLKDGPTSALAVRQLTARCVGRSLVERLRSAGTDITVTWNGRRDDSDWAHVRAVFRAGLYATVRSALSVTGAEQWCIAAPQGHHNRARDMTDQYANRRLGGHVECDWSVLVRHVEVRDLARRSPLGSDGIRPASLARNRAASAPATRVRVTSLATPPPLRRRARSGAHDRSRRSTGGDSVTPSRSADRDSGRMAPGSGLAGLCAAATRPHRRDDQ